MADTLLFSLIFAVLIILPIGAFWMLMDVTNKLSLTYAINLSLFFDAARDLLQQKKTSEALAVWNSKFCANFLKEWLPRYIAIGGDKDSLVLVQKELELSYWVWWTNQKRHWRSALIQLSLLAGLLGATISIFSHNDIPLALWVTAIIAGMIVVLCDISLGVLHFWGNLQYDILIYHLKRLTQTLIFFEIPPTEKPEE